MRTGGRWCTLFLLAAVMVLGVVVRYPTDLHLHEAGADGSYYAALTHLITTYGRAPWTANPLSYFGLFPYSEGVAAPLIVAQFASLAGLPEGLSVVMATDLVAIVGSLGVFLCILRTTRSGFGAVVGSLAFLIAPIGILYSNEVLASRFYLICWVPFILLAFVERRKWGVLRSFLVGIPLVVLVAATHLSFVLVFALFAGVFVLELIEKTWMRIRWSRTFRRPIAALSKFYYAVFLAGCAVLVLATTLLPISYGSEGAGLSNYEIGVFQGNSAFAALANILISTAGGAGLMGVVLTLAAPRLWTLGNRPFTLPILAAVLLVFALLGFRLYARPLVATILAIGAGLGIVGLEQFRQGRKHPRLKRGAAILAILLVAVSIPTSIAIADRWSSAEAFTVSGSAYSAFTYIRDDTSGNLFCNHYPSDRFLTAYTGRVCSPDLPGSSLEMVPFVASTYPWSNLRVRPLGFPEIMGSGTTLELFSVEGYNPYSIYFQVANAPLASGAYLLARYNVTYVLEYRQFENAYAIRWTSDSPTPSPFFASVRNQSYLVFQNEVFDTWSI